MKLCKTCKVEKPESEFYAHKETKDGLRGSCKPCMTLQNKRWCEANREKCVQYALAYQKRRPDVKRKHSLAHYARNREARLAKCREWRVANAEYVAERAASLRAEHPEREAARTAVRYAVKRGEIVKPAACERCCDAGSLEGHHHSYERAHWLDVEWLCRSCHRNEHHTDARLYRDAMPAADSMPDE